jgi:hypothetical protein
MSKPTFRRNVLSFAIASLACSSVADAAIVDGIIGAGEYSVPGVTLNLGWATDDGAPNVEGTFSYVIEGGLIYASLSSPTDFTDNVYGAPSTEASSGWGSGREFDKLLGSDRLLFGLDLDGDGSNDMSVVIDYLARDTGIGYDRLDLTGTDRGPDDGVINKPGTYVQGAEDAVQNEYRAVFGEYGGSVVQDVATSLEYNLSVGCGDTTDSADLTDPSTDAGCSEVFTFEWSMAASAFTDFAASNVLAPLMHASPSKIAAVPEPTGMTLFLVGLVSLGLSRKRTTRIS